MIMSNAPNILVWHRNLIFRVQQNFKSIVVDSMKFNVYKSKRSGGLTTLPERVVKTVVQGLCGDSAAGVVPEVVNVGDTALGFFAVCGDCCDCGIGDDRVELVVLVVSEGESSVKCSVIGFLVVFTKAERLRRSVPLFVLTR